MQCQSHAGSILGCSDVGMGPNLSLGIAPGSKTTPEKGMEEEINENKICLDTAATAGSHSYLGAEAQHSQDQGPILPVQSQDPGESFGGSWGESLGGALFQRSRGRIPPPLSAPDLSQCFVASLGCFSF